MAAPHSPPICCIIMDTRGGHSYPPDLESYVRLRKLSTCPSQHEGIKFETDNAEYLNCIVVEILVSNPSYPG